jgi:hypothetical protein
VPHTIVRRVPARTTGGWITGPGRDFFQRIAPVAASRRNSAFDFVATKTSRPSVTGGASALPPMSTDQRLRPSLPSRATRRLFQVAASTRPPSHATEATRSASSARHICVGPGWDDSVQRLTEPSRPATTARPPAPATP